MDRSVTSVGLGDTAPDFELTAANLPETFRSQALLARGPLIVEFLRGTW